MKPVVGKGEAGIRGRRYKGLACTGIAVKLHVTGAEILVYVWQVYTILLFSFFLSIYLLGPFTITVHFKTDTNEKN